MDPKSENRESLEERLRAHPVLRMQIERMLDEVEYRGGVLNTADEAEDALVTRMRVMARDGLLEWAQQRQAQVQPGWAPQLRRAGKKTPLVEHRRVAYAARAVLATWLQARAALQRTRASEGAGQFPPGTTSLDGLRRRRGVCPRRRQIQGALRGGGGVSRVRATTLQHAHRKATRQPAPVRTLPAQGPKAIIAEADGTMVPTVDNAFAPVGADRRKYRQVRWQEARLVAAQAQGSATTHYEATLHGIEAAGALWETAVRAAGRGLQTAVHRVGDGAPWIAEQCLRRFDPFARYTLDLYHVCDHLAAAALPAGSDVAPQRELLRANRSNEVPAQLRPRLEPAEQPDEFAPVRCAVRYFENRPDQLDYAGALAGGLPVGSGLIESGHRHVLQKRIKLAGAWWTPANVHALALLRNCRANARFDAYWAQN